MPSHIFSEKEDDSPVQPPAASRHPPAARRPPGTAKCVIRTALFDKRQTDVLKGIIFNRLPNATRALTNRAKLGIVVSQFHRFRQIISDYDVFISEMSQVIYTMMNRGYTRRSLVKKFRGCDVRIPGMHAVAV